MKRAIKRPQHHRRWAIGLWVAAGFVAGVIIASVNIWPDFFKRFQWAASGGGGESAMWGEPLFYMVILGVPGGLVGAAIGLAMAFAHRRMTKREI